MCVFTCTHTHLSHKFQRTNQPIILLYLYLWRFWVTLICIQTGRQKIPSEIKMLSFSGSIKQNNEVKTLIYFFLLQYLYFWRLVGFLWWKKISVIFWFGDAKLKNMKTWWEPGDYLTEWKGHCSCFLLIYKHIDFCSALQENPVWRNTTGSNPWSEL